MGRRKAASKPDDLDADLDAEAKTQDFIPPIPEEAVRHWADDSLILFGSFRGYIKSVSTDWTGELTIKLGIDPETKHEAFKHSDYSGMLFTFDSYFRPRRPRTMGGWDVEDDSEVTGVRDGWDWSDDDDSDEDGGR